MKIRGTWIAAGVIGAVIGLAVLSAPLGNLIMSLEGVLPGWGAGGLGLYVLIYAAAPLLMLPAFPFSLGAGIIFGFWHGLLVAMLGSVLTASAGFLLSRRFLRQRIERKIRRNRRFTAIDRMVGREGWKIVGLLRLSWLHCGFSNYAYGLTAIPFRPYILISLLALLPGNVVSVYLGAAGMIGYEALVGAGRERSTVEYVLLGVGAAAGIAAIALISLKAKRAVETAASRC